jgi:hypothetical protein
VRETWIVLRIYKISNQKLELKVTEHIREQRKRMEDLWTKIIAD